MRIITIFSLFLFPLWMQAQSLYFPPTSGSQWDTLSPASLGWCQPQIDSLYDFLDAKESKAFILLKDGKIVLEKYFDSFTRDSSWYWASAGKTLTAFVVGLAQQEGHLSISDTTSTYLGAGWTSAPAAKEDMITIRHQLTMTTGLDDTYGDCKVDTCLIYVADAGTRWAYHNGPYTLLDDVIAAATGQNLNQYMLSRLKIPTGMDGLFIPLAENNVYFSKPRSMARYGLLLLANGNWDGNQIMTDTAYLSQMVNTSQNLNEAYGYLTWLNGKSSFMIPQTQFVFPGTAMGNAPSDMYAALGKNGQILNVVPSQNMVWIRMGNPPPGSSGLISMDLNDEIWAYINDFGCTTAVEESMEEGELSIFPNPANQEVNIRSAKGISSVKIFAVSGKLWQNFELAIPRDEVGISLNGMPGGIYFVEVLKANGMKQVKRLVVE